MPKKVDKNLQDSTIKLTKSKSRRTYKHFDDYRPAFSVDSRVVPEYFIDDLIKDMHIFLCELDDKGIKLKSTFTLEEFWLKRHRIPRRTYQGWFLRRSDLQEANENLKEGLGILRERASLYGLVVNDSLITKNHHYYSKPQLASLELFEKIKQTIVNNADSATRLLAAIAACQQGVNPWPDSK